MQSHVEDKYDTDHIESTGNDKLAGDEHVVDSVAADYVDRSVVISDEENKRLRKRIFKHLLPVMCASYITQSLDKGSLGSASIMGWQKDVHSQGQDYALTSTFLWVGIIIGEPIANQLCRRYPVAKILGYSMLAWSGLVMGLGFALKVPEVWAIRLLLGLFESTFSPCLVSITVQWFTVPEQTFITTIWQAMFGIAGVVSNLMAYGFYHIKRKEAGHMQGWQWMQVCIACISFVASAIVLIFLPDTPVQARWATDDEKTKFVERVRKNDQGIKQKKWKSDQAKEAFTDPATWLLFLMMFILSSVVGGINTFNSILINTAFGFSVEDSLLVSIPMSVFQVCVYFIVAWIGTKTRQTLLTMIGCTCINIVGTIVLLTVAPGKKTRGGLLVAFYLMQCFQATNPSMYAMLSRNVAGQTKKSIVYALFFVAWAGGNAVGPQIFQTRWKTRYFHSLHIHLALYGAFIITVLIMRTVLSRRNKKRDEVISSSEIEHVHAFEDMTDLQNMEFRYSY